VERGAQFLSDGEVAENQAPSFVRLIFQDSAPASQRLQEVVFIEAFLDHVTNGVEADALPFGAHQRLDSRQQALRAIHSSLA